MLVPRFRGWLEGGARRVPPPRTSTQVDRHTATMFGCRGPRHRRSDYRLALRELADADVLARVAHGDARAFAEIYDRVAGSVFAMLVRTTNSATLAEAMTHQTMIIMWREAPRYQATEHSVGAWALQIARRHVAASTPGIGTFSQPQLEAVRACVPSPRRSDAAEHVEPE